MKKNHVSETEEISISYVLCERKKNHKQIDVNDIYPCKITIYMIIKNHIKSIEKYIQMNDYKN